MYILRAPDGFLLLVVVSFRSSFFYPGGMMMMVMGMEDPFFLFLFFPLGAAVNKVHPSLIGSRA